MTDHLNDDILQELEAIMEEEFPILLETYLRESATQRDRISEAWAAGNLEDLRRGAHSLKGGSGNIGAEQLAALCAELERQAREACVDEVADTLARVTGELEAVQAEVASLYQTR